MIKNVVPKVAIKNSPLIESPQTGAAAIMDDTVYTMDDSRVLMGGQVTIHPNIRARVKTPIIHTNIRIRR